MTSFTPLARHDLSAAQVGEIEDRLYDFNRRATGHDDGRGLAFVIADDGGATVAAVAGWSWGGTAEIQQLWVDAAHRGRGHARALLAAFLDEARRRAVRRVWVTSHDFQAPGLYEKLGFTRLATFDDWPEGHARIVLCRVFAP